MLAAKLACTHPRIRNLDTSIQESRVELEQKRKRRESHPNRTHTSKQP